MESVEFNKLRSKSCRMAISHFTAPPLRWHFSEKQHIGEFLNQLLSIKSAYSPEITLAAAEEILGVFKIQGNWCLNWPMTLLETKKS